MSAKKRILVVEDEPSSSRLIEAVLSESGFEVVLASNGLDGLKMAKTENPRLVILDVMLPGMDGFEVCSRIRSDPSIQRLPVLFLSAKARESDKDMGLRVGSDDYLVKPVDPPFLVKRITDIIASKTMSSSRVIAFVGCKGGVGTSTVAVNIAAQAAQSGRNVILLSPCAKFDAVPSLLSLDTSKGITKFLGDPDDKTGDNWIVATSITHYTGLKVLFNLRSGETDTGLTASDIATLTQRTREFADLIFVDISGQPSNVWQSSLSNFDVVLLVTDSGPDGLDNARAAASSFLKDVTKAKGLVIVDRDGALADLEFSKMKPIVESSLGIPLVQIVPHDLKIPLEFEQRGLPIVLADPNRPAAMAIIDLGQRLTEPHFGTSDERGQNG